MHLIPVIPRTHSYLPAVLSCPRNEQTHLSTVFYLESARRSVAWPASSVQSPRNPGIQFVLHNIAPLAQHQYRLKTIGVCAQQEQREPSQDSRRREDGPEPMQRSFLS